VNKPQSLPLFINMADITVVKEMKKLYRWVVKVGVYHMFLLLNLGAFPALLIHISTYVGLPIHGLPDHL